MAITKQKKQEVVAKVKDAVKGASSIVFVNFKGLSVESTSAMRRDLKEQGVGYMVAKKTLIQHALSNESYKGELPELPGEIAVAWNTGDPTTAARAVYTNGKKYPDTLSIVGGVFEGAYQDATHMNVIATIPPLPVLRGMFVNIINSPIQSFVIALNQIAEKSA